MPDRSESAIQRPDIIHRLQQFLGLRQWSVVPHLVDGVQAVVIMGDVREVADEKVISRPCAATLQILADIPGLHASATIANPLGSGVVVRINAIEISQPPATLTLQVGGIALGPGGAAFRDLPALGPIPRAQVAGDLSAVTGQQHYAVLSTGLREWGTGWTLHPGVLLRIDWEDISGLGLLHRLSLMWTESTLRSA